MTNGLALAAHFGDGMLRPSDLAGGIVGAVVRDRDGWGDFYDACRELA